MRTEETLRVLDDLIRERSILQHPFYRAWQRGELPAISLPPILASIIPMSRLSRLIWRMRLAAQKIPLPGARCRTTYSMN